MQCMSYFLPHYRKTYLISPKFRNVSTMNEYLLCVLQQVFEVSTCRRQRDNVVSSSPPSSANSKPKSERQPSRKAAKLSSGSIISYFLNLFSNPDRKFCIVSKRTLHIDFLVGSSSRRRSCCRLSHNLSKAERKPERSIRHRHIFRQLFPNLLP